MRTLTVAFLAAAFLLTLSSAEARDRERTIRCESTGSKYNYCQTGMEGRVELRKQLSDMRCTEYDTWGADGDGSGIWVRGGCRAEFVVREERGWGRWRDRDRDRDRDDDGGRGDVSRIRCASKDWGYEHCDVRGRFRDVQITRQISKTRCERGDNWGFDRAGIWVDRGCEAEFEAR